MSGFSVQMVFSPRSCSLELLEKNLTPDRRALAERIVNQIRSSEGTGTAYYDLLIGPRGSGKTHVIAYVYKRVEADPELSSRLTLIRLSEEERGITSLLDFLVACLRAVSDPGSDLASQIAERRSPDPTDAAIELFSEATQDKPTLVIVENLGNIFRSFDEGGLRDLRRFLQGHPSVSLLASSVNLFSDSAKGDHPFYGFFTIHFLKSMDRKGAQDFLTRLARSAGNEDLAAMLGTRRGQRRVNAIYDLTGGNHRLLAMLSVFLSVDGLSELVGPFVQMVDRELTPYYQQRLDALSPDQNKIVQVIADRHGRALPVNEIARLTVTMSPQVVSRYLVDLRHAALVRFTRRGRESLYELQEPLLRLALDVKEGRDRPLPLVVSLLRDWYEADELRQLEKTAPQKAREYYHAALVERVESVRELETLPSEVGPLRERMETDIPSGAESQLVREGVALRQEGKLTDALARFEEAIKVNPDDAAAWLNRAATVSMLGRSEEAMGVYDEVVARFGDRQEVTLQEQVARALVSKALHLGDLGRSEECVILFDEVAERFGGSEGLRLEVLVAVALVGKGVGLVELGRNEEGIAVFDEVVERFGGSEELRLEEPVAMALVSKGLRLGELGRNEDGIAVFDEVVARFGEREEGMLQWQVAWALGGKGERLGALGRDEQALLAFNEVVERFGERQDVALQGAVARALVCKAVRSKALGRAEEALVAYDNVLCRFRESERPELLGPVARALVNKAVGLAEFGRSEEALVVYDEVVDRFGDREEVELQAVVAEALVNKGLCLMGLGRDQEALVAHDEVVNRFGQSEAEGLQELVMLSLVGRLMVSLNLSREGDAWESLRETLRRPPLGAPFRTLAAELLIARFGDDKERLGKMVKMYGEDAESLKRGLLAWVQTQIPLDEGKARELERTEEALRAVFTPIPEAKQVVDVLSAARRDALGDKKALLELPLEVRRLIQRKKGEPEDD